MKRACPATKGRVEGLRSLYNEKILRLEDLVYAFLRRYDPDQVRGSKTVVFLSASTSAPRAYLVI